MAAWFIAFVDKYQHRLAGSWCITGCMPGEPPSPPQGRVQVAVQPTHLAAVLPHGWLALELNACSHLSICVFVELHTAAIPSKPVAGATTGGCHRLDVCETRDKELVCDIDSRVAGLVGMLCAQASVGFHPAVFVCVVDAVDGPLQLVWAGSDRGCFDNKQHDSCMPGVLASTYGRICMHPDRHNAVVRSQHPVKHLQACTHVR